MDLTYMGSYYEELIEKIMKEALTEEYWSKEDTFCTDYDILLNDVPETMREAVEKIMEHYQIVEAQILKEMYLHGALDMEKTYVGKTDISSSMEILKVEYRKNKKQIYEEVSQKLKGQASVRSEWDQKYTVEKQIYKEMSETICHQYEMLMKRKKAVGAVERKCMYLQGALDRSRMLS